MTTGFFPGSDIASKTPLPTIAQCGACGLYKGCKTPKMTVSGKGKRKILLLGEAPGRQEDEQGRQFVGESGAILQASLARAGIDMRRDCWLHNSLSCHPERNIIKDSNAIDYCRPKVIEAINTLCPDIIIPLGAKAVQSLLGWLWKEDVGPITKWVSWQIPVQKLNTWVCPTWHPAHLLRNQKQARRGDDVLQMMFDRDIDKACQLEGKPWKIIPDYEKQVKRGYGIQEAANFIRGCIQTGRPVAFDYETDRLKPDSDGSRIVCCAVSNGDISVAYPWHGEAIKATGELLSSDVPKIGFNVKFEDRWTKKEFGFPVKNWMWDGMLGAHTLDSRKGTKGLKFQSFVLLGHPSYDDHLKPYMSSANSNAPNRITEVGLDKLLLYCGLDALLEYKVAKIQMDKFGLGEQ